MLAPGGRRDHLRSGDQLDRPVVYGLFHHEPVGLRLPLTWEAPAGFKPGDADYFAAQGAATRIFWRREDPGRLAGWDLCEVTPLPSFEYFATGGFSGPQIGGPAAFRLWRRLDRALSRWPNLFAARLLVVLKRLNDQDSLRLNATAQGGPCCLTSDESQARRSTWKYFPSESHASLNRVIQTVNHGNPVVVRTPRPCPNAPYDLAKPFLRRQRASLQASAS